MVFVIAEEDVLGAEFAEFRATSTCLLVLIEVLTGHCYVAVAACARAKSAFGLDVFGECCCVRGGRPAFLAGVLRVEFTAMLFDFVLIHEHSAVRTFAKIPRAICFVQRGFALREHSFAITACDFSFIVVARHISERSACVSR